jgi:hypothetical protein
MKYAVVVALAMLASIPALAQDQASCNAYFQVLRAEAGTPGLRVGMDSGQKRWWENAGRKKYPGLCLNGAVTSADKPRYLVIWSKSKSIGKSSVTPNQVYGEKSNAVQGTAPTAWIYQPRWDTASVTLLFVAYDGSLELPPVYLAPGNLTLGVLWPNSAKVLEAAVKYLAQEPVFSLSTSKGRSAGN